MKLAIYFKSLVVNEFSRSTASKAHGGFGAISALKFVAAAFVSFAAMTSASADTYINFQPATSAIPSGYIKDSGLGFSATRGFGWVRQDSIANA
ncbi:MAG: hypothetical protein H0W34_05010, partial [Pyrinomonadaceae bacterium]|nr:hypothetical protein [Pyrinomonadaceae bacterium]